MDVATLRTKIEQLQENIDILEKENEYLKNTNQEMNMRKEKIKESLDIGIKELEEAKERVNSLEQEREELKVALYELKDYSDRLEKNNEELLQGKIINKEVSDILNLDFYLPFFHLLA